jgi:hypothetical protein
VEETQLLTHASEKPDICQAVLSVDSLHGPPEAEPLETGFDVMKDRAIRIRDAQNAPAVASLGIEDSRQEPLPPVVGRARRPHDELPNGHLPAQRLVSDRGHFLPESDGSLEDELLGFYSVI